MTQPNSAVRTSGPAKNWIIGVLLLLSAGTLAAGITAPIITIKQLVFWTDTFSVISGMHTLFSEGHLLLGVVVCVFSIIFPVAKLGAMTVLWLGSVDARKKRVLIESLGHLGKWSMLDVFVVAIVVVIAKISALADAHARYGIYVFGASILLSMAASMLLKKETQKNRH